MRLLLAVEIRMRLMPLLLTLLASIGMIGAMLDVTASYPAVVGPLAEDVYSPDSSPAPGIRTITSSKVSALRQSAEHRLPDCAAGGMSVLPAVAATRLPTIHAKATPDLHEAGLRRADYNTPRFPTGPPVKT